MSVEETGSLELFEGKQQEITRQELVERVSEHVNRILRRNLYELKLDERQTFRLLRQKEELRRYLKEAGTGNGRDCAGRGNPDGGSQRCPENQNGGHPCQHGRS